MSKPNFTPGPWRIAGSRANLNFLVVQGDEDTFSPIVCEVKADEGRLPAFDNARLIAAAPALYEALGRLLAAFETDGQISPQMPVIISIETNGGAIREARTALALVEKKGA